MMSSTADLWDEHGDRLQSLTTQFRNYGGRMSFSGPIRTVRCFRDNALLKSTLSTPGGGAVLVVDGNGALESALVGDMIAGLAIANGWAGILVNGAIRDSVALGSLPLGVKALGTNPRTSAKTGEGELDGGVEFGGVSFAVGAMLHSDEDGVVVESNR